MMCLISGLFSLLLGCLVQTQCDFFLNLTTFYFVMLCCYLSEVFYFLVRGRKESGSGRRAGGYQLGGVEGGDTVIRIYCTSYWVHGQKKSYGPSKHCRQYIVKAVGCSPQPEVRTCNRGQHLLVLLNIEKSSW